MRDFRAATAALVEKQSKEMMNLINEKRTEFMRAESLYIEDDYQTEEELLPYPSNPPAPQPPGVAKTDIYHDPLVFADIDQIAISVLNTSFMSHLYNTTVESSTISKLAEHQPS